VSNMPLDGAVLKSKVQNVIDVAVIAQIAILPPKWQAAMSEQSAELAFCVGGWLG